MEKFILKTIFYADIFNFSLKGWEIHKWLIISQTGLSQVEKVLSRLVKIGKLQEEKGYYVLPNRSDLVRLRLKKAQISQELVQKAKLAAYFFKLIFWVKLVGISGALAMENAGKSDDIDLFVITSQNRMWLCRLLMLGILQILGLRRIPGVAKKRAAGKICLNLILEESALEQKKKNLYIAHEVLQMRLLWQRDDMYAKFLSANAWAFKFLPNWRGISTSLRGAKRRGNLDSNQDSYASLGMTIETIAKKLQLKIMKTPTGDEQVEDHALYFHPKDYSKQIIQKDVLKLT